jgi:hypothetical protein
MAEPYYDTWDRSLTRRFDTPNARTHDRHGSPETVIGIARERLAATSAG